MHMPLSDGSLIDWGSYLERPFLHDLVLRSLIQAKVVDLVGDSFIGLLHLHTITGQSSRSSVSFLVMITVCYDWLWTYLLPRRLAKLVFRIRIATSPEHGWQDLKERSPSSYWSHQRQVEARRM